MEARLSLASDSIEAEELQDLTRDLCSLLNEETDVSASQVEGATEAGTRGESIELAVLALAFITSGSAVALFQVFKTILERKPSIEMEFEREDGEKLKIRGEHVSAGQMEKTIALAREFFGASQ